MRKICLVGGGGASRKNKSTDSLFHSKNHYLIVLEMLCLGFWILQNNLQVTLVCRAVCLVAVFCVEILPIELRASEHNMGASEFLHWL